MKPKNSNQRIVDLTFRSRHAAWREGLLGMLFFRQAGAEHPSVLYCGAQGIQGELVRPARAAIASLDAVLCAFPIPALHVRVETDRSVQAASRRDPFVPGVHQAIQRFAGNRSRNANCPRLIEMGNGCALSLSLNRPIMSFPTGFSVRHHTERATRRHHIRRMRSALPCAIFSRSTSLIESVLRNSIPAVFGSYGQSTANRILSAPSASSVHRNAGSYQLPLVVTSRLSFRYSSGVFLRPRRAAARQV